MGAPIHECGVTLGSSFAPAARVVAGGAAVRAVAGAVTASTSNFQYSSLLCVLRGLQMKNTHTAQTTLLFLHTLSPVAFTAILVSQDLSICSQPTAVQVSVLCRRHTFLNSVGAVSSPRVL